MSEFSEFHNHKQQFCGLLSEANPSLSSLPDHIKKLSIDDEFFIQTKPQDIAGLTIGGVDGGYVSKPLVGYDVHFLRAIAVYSTFTKGNIINTVYYPSMSPKVSIEFIDSSHSSYDSEKIGSISRAIAELITAKEVMETSPKHIDILFMDGSPYLKNPGSLNVTSTNLHEKYLNLLSDLVNLSRKKRTKLVWIVKDSRKNVFTTFLGKALTHMSSMIPELLTIDYRGIINKTRDMDLFYYLLNLNMRSFCLLREFEVSEEFNSTYKFLNFYIKTAQYDIPLRIECFFPRGIDDKQVRKEINLLSETILPVSQYNHEYGIPAPIVEADARVKIKDNEINEFFRLFKAFNTIPSFSPRRRDRSPWRF